MSNEERLNALCGVYYQEDGNTFVIASQAGSLTLKMSSSSAEKLIARGDGLYDVENTGAKVKFHLGSGGTAHSLTFYLKDRQTIAKRKLNILKEKSFLDKFKELGIASLVLFSLIGIFLLSANFLKSGCFKNGGNLLCRVASIQQRILGNSKEADGLLSKESESRYKEIDENLRKNCNEKEDSDSCLELAKKYQRINDKETANKLLQKNCYTKKHGDSCQFWYEVAIDEGDTDLANAIMEKSCQAEVSISCHELGHRYQRSGEDAKAIIFFDKACRFGEEKSCYLLGLYHLKYDRDRSFDYFQKSCEAYHRQACDMKEKIERYFEEKEKCSQDIASACFLIGSFEQDYGDRELSFPLYEKACKLGSKSACNLVKNRKAKEELRKNNEQIDTI